MMRHEINMDDAMKLKMAYERLDRWIESVKETNRRLDRPCKISDHVIEAHRCLKEVLYGE